MLVEAGANVCATDNDGNSTIINVTRESRFNNSILLPSAETSPEIFKVGLYYYLSTDKKIYF